MNTATFTHSISIHIKYNYICTYIITCNNPYIYINQQHTKGRWLCLSCLPSSFPCLHSSLAGGARTPRRGVFGPCHIHFGYIFIHMHQMIHTFLLLSPSLLVSRSLSLSHTHTHTHTFKLPLFLCKVLLNLHNHHHLLQFFEVIRSHIDNGTFDQYHHFIAPTQTLS
jgi:hypothetical protein